MKLNPTLEFQSSKKSLTIVMVVEASTHEEGFKILNVRDPLIMNIYAIV